MADLEEKLKLKSNMTEKGVALMIVLWIMMLLIVMALAFSATVRTEVFSTIVFKEQMENKYLAEAGLQRAMLEVLYRNANKSMVSNNDETDVCSVDGTFYQGKMEEGGYHFAITDESGKININLLTDTSGILLNNLLVNRGVEKNQADTIVDSILDWKDGDDVHRMHGAENDYYMSLPHPYKSKDANFTSLEELLLVQGVTRDILYGTEERPGLIEYLTVYTSTAQININAAKPEVLKAIPSLSEETVQMIINYRTSDNAQKDESGLLSILSAENSGTIASYIITADSNMYSVEVIGYRQEKNGGYRLKAVVAAEGVNRCRIVSYQSPAHVVMPKDDAIKKHLQ